MNLRLFNIIIIFIIRWNLLFVLDLMMKRKKIKKSKIVNK
jgi:hypothetical protein